MINAASQVAKVMGGSQNNQAAAPPPQIAQANSGQRRMQDNPLLAQMPGPAQSRPTSNQIMPAPVGIASIPNMAEQMDSRSMTAGLGPNQQNAVSDYLRSQGMVGFA
tara:strand:- start:385 stop:705 length:321 start_codon:yes stop_codon:yes gene_type:complete